MVQYKGLVGKLFHERSGYGQVPGVNQDVVTKTELPELRYTPQKRRTEQEFVVRLILYNVTDSPQLGLLRKMR